MKARTLAYGFMAAALVGALTAVLIHTLSTNNQRSDYFATVKEMVLSSDQDTRRDGWANVDENWNLVDISSMETEVSKGSQDVILDAALAFAQRGIDPQNNLHLYAEAIASDEHDPIQSLIWFEGSNASPLKKWETTICLLLNSEEPPIRNAALSLAVRQCPEGSHDELEEFSECIPVKDTRNQAILQCVLGLAGSTSQDNRKPASATRNILANTKRGIPSPAATLSKVPPSLLHLAPLQEAHIELKRRADTNDKVARKILRSSDSNEMNRTVKRVLDDKTKDIEIRRIAAWQIDQLDDGTAMGVLSANPADGDNTVYATALLAEKHLSKSGLDNLIARWLIDYEANRRRVAAILIALRGDDPTLLQEAEQREHDPAARRTMRMALLSLNAWPLKEVHPEVYAARTRTLKNGRFDPDTALLRIMSKDPNALNVLAHQPELPDSNLSESDRVNWRREMQWRDWILKRTVPQWHQLVGEPFGGDESGLRLRLDLLEAIRLLQSEHLEWDSQCRRWRVVAKAGPDKDYVNNE